jgi:membrane-bound metal-dependent hydrolase YbcI (DUF457 family)
MPVAHGLLGATIVTTVHPEPWRYYGAPFLAGMVLANLPDLDLITVLIIHSRGWHRTVTHSLITAAVVLLIFGFAFGRAHLREAFAYGLAFASHGIVDFATTTVGGGVALFSPISWHRFRLDWFGLSENPSRFPSAAIVKMIAWEFLLFLPPLLLLLGLRIYLAKRSGAGTGLKSSSTPS